MTPPSTLHSQSDSRTGRRSRRAGNAEDPAEKPKKVNSEIRKQQNRIASRNYREKRKRKLQYLQQLIKDGSNDEQTPEPSPQQHEAHLRPLSAEYEARPSSSPFILPATTDFASMNLSRSEALGHTRVSSAASFDDQLLPTSQAYSSCETSWSSPMYEPTLPANMAYIPTWMASDDYSSQEIPCPEGFQFSPQLRQSGFEQAPSLYNHPREFSLHANQFAITPSYESYSGSHSQMSIVPSVSLPAPSPYFHPQYRAPH